MNINEFASIWRHRLNHSDLNSGSSHWISYLKYCLHKTDSIRATRKNRSKKTNKRMKIERRDNLICDVDLTDNLKSAEHLFQKSREQIERLKTKKSMTELMKRNHANLYLLKNERYVSIVFWSSKAERSIARRRRIE